MNGPAADQIDSFIGHLRAGRMMIWEVPYETTLEYFADRGWEYEIIEAWGKGVIGVRFRRRGPA